MAPPARREWEPIFAVSNPSVNAPVDNTACRTAATICVLVMWWKGPSALGL